MTDTSEVTVCLVNKHGLHARPAHLFVETASAFVSDIRVLSADRDMGGDEMDGKTIMGLMMLAAERGAELTIRAEGPDADAAIHALAELVRSGFGER